MYILYTHILYYIIYISNVYLLQNTFGVKKVQVSKVESYLEVNAWTD